MTDISQRILNIDQLTRRGHVAGRQAMLQILEAGLRAADPYNNTRAMLKLEGDQLAVGHTAFCPPGAPHPAQRIYDLRQIDRILVLGAGKGIQRMAKAFEDVLGERLTGGHVIDKHGGPLILERIGVSYGAHPVPDEGCVEGCRRILALTQDLTERDLVFTVSANGISSLLTLPVEGVSLEDVRQTTHLMQIQRGALTEDLNPVRNHLDQLKGGRLTRHIQPAQAVHIVAWKNTPYEDLVYKNIWLHPLPESSTYAKAIEMLHKYDAWDETPLAVREHLLRADPAGETVKPAEFELTDFMICCSMPEELGMLPTARAKAEELGFKTLVLTSWWRPEASQTGLAVADIANCAEREGQPLEPPCAILSAGEMRVTVGKENGMGGRNQEYCVSAALRISGSPHIVMASVDSDGTDGPGKQFIGEGYEHVPVLGGGIVDGQTAQLAQEQDVNLWDALKRHDTSEALDKLDSGIIISHNISMTDLSVTLVLDRGTNPQWTR